MSESDRTGSDESDGYHTFDELYDHRRALTVALAAAVHSLYAPVYTWRSRFHHPDDDDIFPGYFIVGIKLEGYGTITYHYQNKHWQDFEFVPTLPHAPKWDGATPDDTVTRLLAWSGETR